MPPPIQPDWTLSKLQAECPGIELTLFSHFGIGSRERSGFSGSERLDELLRRHLVFDAEKACQRLTVLAHEDYRNAVNCSDFLNEYLNGNGVVLDVRSPEEFALCHLSEAKFLNADTVQEIQRSPDTPVVVVCRDGSQSPAASRMLRKLGLKVKHLNGGLLAWALTWDPTFPILYPLDEIPERWYLLADGQTLRYRLPSSATAQEYKVLESAHLESFPEGRNFLMELPQTELVISTPHGFAVRGKWTNLGTVIEYCDSELVVQDCWNQHGRTSQEVEERDLLVKTLAEEAPKILASHKGTVEVQDYSARVVTLALGGGCAGCASANITTKRELAAGLYRAVPVLNKILSATSS